MSEETDNQPTDEEVGKAFMTLIAVCEAAGGQLAASAVRISLKDGSEKVFHIEIHDASLCSHDDVAEMLVATPLDKSQVN